MECREAIRQGLLRFSDQQKAEIYKLQNAFSRIDSVSVAAGYGASCRQVQDCPADRLISAHAGSTGPSADGPPNSDVSEDCDHARSGHCPADQSLFRPQRHASENSSPSARKSGLSWTTNWNCSGDWRPRGWAHTGTRRPDSRQRPIPIDAMHRQLYSIRNITRQRFAIDPNRDDPNPTPEEIFQEMHHRQQVIERFKMEQSQQGPPPNPAELDPGNELHDPARTVCRRRSQQRPHHRNPRAHRKHHSSRRRI